MHPGKTHFPLQIMALEPRWMFDGAAAVDVAGDFSDPAADVGAKAPVTVDPPAVRAAERKDVAFIDSSVTGWQQLVAGVKPGVEVVILDPAKDGLTQIAAWAESHFGYDSMHVLSHGSDGEVILGGLVLDQATAEARAAELAVIGQALTSDGDILLYGCRTGTGSEFLSTLSRLTGADVAASTDDTGSAARGGDWVLEANAGSVETVAMEISEFSGRLAARSAVDGAGGDAEVFLGGDWIEIGINKAGNFGAVAAKPGGFSGATSASIGLVLDLDGFDSGATTRTDYFVPGTPLAAWGIGFNDGVGDFQSSNVNNGGSAVTSVTENVASTVTDRTAGNALAARIVSTYAAGGAGGSVSMQQDITFDVADRSFDVSVTITNNGTVDLTNVTYSWIVDPDQGTNLGKGSTTVNTVHQTITAGDSKNLIESKLPASANTTANIYIESSNSSTRLAHNQNLAQPNPFSLWAAPSTKGDTVTADKGIAISYRANSLAQTASTTFTYKVYLTTLDLSGATTTTTLEPVRATPPALAEAPKEGTKPPAAAEISAPVIVKAGAPEGGTPIINALRADSKPEGMGTVVRDAAAPQTSTSDGLAALSARTIADAGPAATRSAESNIALAPTLSAPSDGGFRVAVAADSARLGGETITVARPIGEVVQTGRVAFGIPADAFAVAKADAQVSLTATLADGQPLPSWLAFNPVTGRFEGTPPPGETGTIDIKVSARDQAGAEAAQVFKVVVRGQGADAGRDPAASRHAFAGKAGLAEQIRAAKGSPARFASLVHLAARGRVA